MAEYDYQFKIITLGNAGVGKTSLVSRYADDTFKEDNEVTIGVDFKIKTLKIYGKVI